MKRISIRGVVLPTLVAAAVLLGSAAGCSKEEPPSRPVVRQPAPKLAEKPVSPQKPSEAEGKKTEGKKAEGVAVALYNAAGRRDPFTPFLKAETNRRGKGDLVAVPPLQRYDIGELKFVGVIWRKTGAFGLVEDAEGKGYTVTVGMRIGRSGGVVTRITEKEIAVREEMVGARGDRILRENVLQLTTAGGK